MNVSLQKSLLYFLLAPIVAIIIFAEPITAQTRKAELKTNVEAYLKPYLVMKGFSGSILIAEKGTILLKKGYGMANYELNVPNTPETEFHIASLSKTFTSAAIMLLEEDGKLSTQDPVSKFVPDYPRGEEITIHHLLTHTSGIPDINGFPEYQQLSKFPQTPESLVKIFRDKPLLWRPGERYRYSNSNYNLLALIIEHVSGMAYGDFLKEYIFDPLTLTCTGTDNDAGKILSNRASGYVPAGVSDLENAPYIDWSAKTGNGSLYSTVEDLYQWDRALIAGNFLREDFRKKIFTKYADSSIGYGWFLGKRLNRDVIRMSGRSPGFNAEMQHYTGDDLVVVVLSNNYAPTAGIIATDLAAIVLGEHYETPEFATPVNPDPQKLRKFAGRYDGGDIFFSPGTIIDIQDSASTLFMKWSTGAVVELTPQSDSTFFDRVFWAKVSFTKISEKSPGRLIWNYAGRDYIATKVTKQ